MACVQSYPPTNTKECRKILNEVDQINPIVALMLEFSALTGLRYSDFSKLKVSDLFINGQVREDVTIIQQKPYNKRLSSGTKKAVARDLSKVDIYINEQCQALISDAMRLGRLDSVTDTSKLLFESSRIQGKPYSNQYINKLLKTVAIKLRLNYPLSTHSFRKMFAKLYIKNGAAIHQVRDALGQSSLQATDHYLRTFISENKKFSEKILF